MLTKEHAWKEHLVHLRRFTGHLPAGLLLLSRCVAEGEQMLLQRGEQAVQVCWRLAAVTAHQRHQLLHRQLPEGEQGLHLPERLLLEGGGAVSNLITFGCTIYSLHKLLFITLFIHNI